MPLRIRLKDTFPFTPPIVALPSAPVTLTWHLNPGGTLCLFRASDDPDRPWETVDGLFKRIAYWYDQRRQGWPDDPGDPDLQRYFDENRSFLVTYRTDEHPVGHLTWEKAGANWFRVAVSHKNRAARRRGGETWRYGVDIGVLKDPVWDWPTLLDAMTDADREEVEKIATKATGVLLVHYAREGNEGTRQAAIALMVKPSSPARRPQQGRAAPVAPPASAPNPSLLALEIADDSPGARWYRAGLHRHTLRTKHVAIVGCGAVGSFTAELLARSGVATFTLLDPERLVPGNCVRHLADRSHVPKYKVDAVRDILVARELVDHDNISPVNKPLTAEIAADLLMNVDLVIDATANAATSGLLRDLAHQMGRVSFLKVGVHRDGALVRVDRFGEGTRPDDERPPFIDALPGATSTYRENGCGDPVSTTPPQSVVQAAAIAARFAVDALRPTVQQQLPDALVEVLVPQPDEPWKTIGARS